MTRARNNTHWKNHKQVSFFYALPKDISRITPSRNDDGMGRTLAIGILVFLLIAALPTERPTVADGTTTVAIGDQITLTLRDGLVDCVDTILITSSAEIRGDFHEIISLRGELVTPPTYEAPNVSMCEVYSSIINGNPRIDVIITNATVRPSQFLRVRLSYTLGGILKFANDSWNLDFHLTSSIGNGEIVIRVPKPSSEFSEVRFSDVVPFPNAFYEEESYYVFAWQSPIFSYGTTSQYYVRLSYKEVPRTYSILTFLAGIIGGFVLSLVSAWVWQWLNRPRLRIQAIPLKSPGEPAVQAIQGSRRAFYHIKVINEGGSTAYECEANIVFRSSDGRELFRVKGKWDRQPEPLIPLAIGFDGGEQKISIQDFPYQSLVPVAEITNIKPSIPEAFALIMKYEGEKECYAFGSWSYQRGYEKGLRVDEWKLDTGQFRADIEVRGANAVSRSVLWLENRGVRLEDIGISAISDRTNTQSHSERP
jgi:hypothetical protein